MPLVFTERYIKGFAFDHNKVAKAYDCEPYSPEAYQILEIIHENFRDSYISAASGYLPGETYKDMKIILVLDSGDNYEELEAKELKDLPSWFKAATKTALTGPKVYEYYP